MKSKFNLSDEINIYIKIYLKLVQYMAYLLIFFFAII